MKTKIRTVLSTGTVHEELKGRARTNKTHYGALDILWLWDFEIIYDKQRDLRPWLAFRLLHRLNVEEIPHPVEEWKRRFLRIEPQDLKGRVCRPFMTSLAMDLECIEDILQGYIVTPKTRRVPMSEIMVGAAVAFAKAVTPKDTGWLKELQMEQETLVLLPGSREYVNYAQYLIKKQTRA